ncbi:hypothetical protein BT93_D1731 [Corymbia citriodora subsp. variegata]|nr:hypothetical protein BT93_D1731 [Corymbia citriodora subsp. variegata]
MVGEVRNRNDGGSKQGFADGLSWSVGNTMDRKDLPMGTKTDNEVSRRGGLSRTHSKCRLKHLPQEINLYNKH